MAEGSKGALPERVNSICADSERIALITGVTGQDGSYLAEFLLKKGYKVHGIIRRSSSFNTGKIKHLYQNPILHEGGDFHLHYGDVTDSSCLVKLISEIRPTEIYNLAAQSHVKLSFDLSEYTADVNGLGTLRLLDAIRTCGLEKKVKLYQASTSELYGKVQEIPQTEKTPFYPRSPYAAAKLYAYWVVVNYREGYGMFACNGILFNHESPRRGENFVTRKVSRSVAQVHLGHRESACFDKEVKHYLYKDHYREFHCIGNLDAQRDWGHAKDYVEAMWMILQLEAPDDFVIATNKTHSVRYLVELAFKEININISWRGKGLDEQGVDQNNVVRVTVNPRFYRPTEVDYLQGDASKAKTVLGWEPKTTFEELVKEMVKADIELLTKDPTA